MYSKLVKKALTISAITMLAACSITQGHKSQQMSASTFDTKEKLYQSTANYPGLINLYRNVLQYQVNTGNHKADPKLSYKLAYAYFQNGDSKSALAFLKPLLSNPKYQEQAMALQVKALVQSGQYQQAINVASTLIRRSPTNPNYYNSRGVAYAQLGKIKEAEADFHSARNNFLNDIIALNNIAMINIINGEYDNAVRLLLPKYLNGQKEQRLVHNLVFALVKSGNIQYAKDIIIKEKLNTSPDALIAALKTTEKTSKHITSRR